MQCKACCKARLIIQNAWLDIWKCRFHKWISIVSQSFETLMWVLLCITRWSRPSQVNGVLQFYAIFVSQDGAEPTVVHNSSKLVEEHTLRNLTPGTAYDITVAVSLWILIFTLLSWILVYLCAHFRLAQALAAPEAPLLRLSLRKARQRMCRPHWSPLCPHMLSTSAGPLLILRMVRRASPFCHISECMHC